MNDLIIRLNLEPSGNITWTQKCADGAVQIQKGTLDELAQKIDRQRVIVLVPGADVLLATVTIPAGKRKLASHTVPYALEDQLAVEVEKLHFAFGKEEDEGALAVAVVDKERLEHWLQVLHDASIVPDLLLPETLAVPYKENSWTVLVDNGLALVRTGQQSGFAVDTNNFKSALAAQNRARENEQPLSLRLLNCTGEEIRLPEMHGVQPVTEELGSKPDALCALSRLANGFDDELALNLLQGPYKPHTEWEPSWRRWRLPLVLAGLILVLHGLLAVGEFFGLRAENRGLTLEIVRIYRGTFPEAKKVVNPRVEMEQKLTALRGSQGSRKDFLRIIEGSGGELTKTPGFRLKNLRYRDGLLDLDLEVAHLQALDDLKNRLTAIHGKEVEIRSASSKKNRVEARIRIREK